MKTKSSIAKTAIPNTLAFRLRTACAARLLPALLLLMLPTVVQAQFNYTINNGAIIITGYTRSGDTVTIPSTDLANPVWSPLQTNTLTGGSCYFSDSQWTNYPGRFYRLRSP